MKKTFWIFVCFFFLSPSFAQANKEEELDTYMERFLKEYNVPGASVALMKDGKVFYENNWGGTAKKEQKITSSTPFLLGSISKSFTALGILSLYEEGKIHLHEPITTYLPSFTLQDSSSSEKITVQHLLTHTSGFSTYDGLKISDLELTHKGAIQHAVSQLSNVSLTANPGEKHQYSNANFIILGALIEEVTGESYASYMNKHVFEPLEMKQAGADRDASLQNGYVRGYQSWFGFPVKTSVSYDNSGAPYGYLAASTRDIIQYLQFLDQKGSSLLQEDTWEHYKTPFVQTGDDCYYGLGVRITNPGKEEEMIWHSGSTPDAHGEVFYLPQKRIGGVILTNKNHIFEEEGLVYVKQGILDIIDGKTPVDPPPFFPGIQVGASCALLLLMFFFFYRIKKKSINRITQGILSLFFLVLAIGIVPSFVKLTSSPWSSIHHFAPDLAWITYSFVFLLALHSFLSFFLFFSKRPLDKNSIKGIKL